MSDTRYHSTGLDSPPARLAEIAPSDTEDLPRPTRAINVAGAGLVRVTTIEGDTGTLYIAAGLAFPLRARRIWATGTDATGITGLD